MGSIIESDTQTTGYFCLQIATDPQGYNSGRTYYLRTESKSLHDDIMPLLRKYSVAARERAQASTLFQKTQRRVRKVHSVTGGTLPPTVPSQSRFERAAANSLSRHHTPVRDRSPTLIASPPLRPASRAQPPPAPRAASTAPDAFHVPSARRAPAPSHGRYIGNEEEGICAGDAPSPAPAAVPARAPPGVSPFHLPDHYRPHHRRGECPAPTPPPPPPPPIPPHRTLPPPHPHPRPHPGSAPDRLAADSHCHAVSES